MPAMKHNTLTDLEMREWANCLRLLVSQLISSHKDLHPVWQQTSKQNFTSLAIAPTMHSDQLP